MKDEYKGTIVEESLIDNRALNDHKIIGFKISKEENMDRKNKAYIFNLS